MDNLNFNSGPIVNEITNGLRKYMISVYNKMFLALILTGLVSFVCASNVAVLQFMLGGFPYILMFATLGIVIYLSARINKMSADRANILFWFYSALIGATLSPMIVFYTGESIANAFFMTAIFFGSMSLYGYTTKRDLTGVGSFMRVGLFAIIITSLVNVFFLKSSALQLGISVLTVIIFCGLTAFDVQKIKSFYNPSMPEENVRKSSIMGALVLYLDFINMFLALLRIFGDRRQ